ncbi:MAG: hypothetical protein GY906_25190 [bacterium]|nr:hypothetical protein [bacterium]
MGAQEPLDLDAHEDLDAAYREIANHRPLPLGRYLLLRARPDRPYWTYQAVVHDLDKHPSCCAGDVRRSLVAIVRDALKRELRALAFGPIGCRKDSGLEIREMVEALDATVLELAAFKKISTSLTLLLPSVNQIEEVSHLLRSNVLRRASRSFRTVGEGAAVAEIRHRRTRLHYRFVPGSLSGYQVTWHQAEECV